MDDDRTSITLCGQLRVSPYLVNHSFEKDLEFHCVVHLHSNSVSVHRCRLINFEVVPKMFVYGARYSAETSFR